MAFAARRTRQQRRKPRERGHLERRSYWQAMRVTARPYALEHEAHVEHVAPDLFSLHPLAAMLLQPRFSGAPLKLVGEALSHDLIRAWHFQGISDDPKSVAVRCDLILYVGSGEPWVRYEIRLMACSREVPTMPWSDAALDWLTPPGRPYVIRDRRGIYWSRQHLDGWWHASALRSHGVVLPVPRPGEVTEEQRATMLAEHDADLISGDVPWPLWGIFDAEQESGDHADALRE